MRYPCGHLTDPNRACRCSPIAIDRYLSKISGPLLDRIDIHLEVPAVPFDELRGRGKGTGSDELREQVRRARNVQRQRFETDPVLVNGRMSGRQIRQFCQLDKPSEELLRQAVEELGLSNRAHDRVLRVARTIADLDESEPIKPHHLAEAIQLRRLDRKLWT